ncbi:hypothetical protein AQUCO_01300013v1 [Aquilegia coerulea]|uniref:AB hydrolase-1 domain-containing protein n=1 Tax=Aquilegia coerulea TaxID=218851 RepID=A0A2G5DZ80_AQUCA|nr:hypothetical protein AQUCO_01300013v1 [Aquilegia coerulea]
MGVSATRSAVTMMGKAINEVLSLLVFSILDLLDVFLCFVYKVADFFIEAEWKPCYCCSSSAKDAITNSRKNNNKIVVSEQLAAGGDSSKIVCVCSTNYKLDDSFLDDISDTLYTRSSIVSDISKSTAYKELKRIKRVEKRTTTVITSSSTSNYDEHSNKIKSTTLKINSTLIEMLQGKISGPPQSFLTATTTTRWSDCDCITCSSWSSSRKDTLFVHTQGPKDNAKEDVLFIHGFISSSTFWTETLFPNFSAATKSSHRLLAVDLLGFGKSPKPTDSLYTLREHVDMIERSAIEPYKMQSFHIVAHSLGCILALAIAVKYPKAIKSLTLLAPPYFSVPKGEQATQYVMRRIAPRRVWPLIAFGASLACWYEHISRTICFLICKNHRLWEFIIKFITRNRIKTFLIDGFMCHTHNAAWHTLHNIICGTAGKMEGYLDEIRDILKCHVTIFHGRDDELLPVECSYNVQSKIPRASLKVIEKKDHITVVVGRQKAFARELEEIWSKSSTS